MRGKQRSVSVGILLLASAIACEQGFVVNPKWYFLLFITVPLLIAYSFSVRE
ncbi:hypothetical protein Niako_4919 [Niastella koreensis GR20-10]|uniref:Uncharacterized protein n=1 Tax=Niastella koreensis (strain DSM 17620 / KACC 11465 / NBRC 106392 / GR20-10) TaxID=700598 RepID=G8T7C3_NIAKG|nr:hypothetical protein [Niastella koreensis]AEW01159.1 hypothetical protein Niako_4919 [Niastella koreensis GR20-10]